VQGNLWFLLGICLISPSGKHGSVFALKGRSRILNLKKKPEVTQKYQAIFHFLMWQLVILSPTTTNF